MLSFLVLTYSPSDPFRFIYFNQMNLAVKASFSTTVSVFFHLTFLSSTYCPPFLYSASISLSHPADSSRGEAQPPARAPRRLHPICCALLLTSMLTSHGTLLRVLADYVRGPHGEGDCEVIIKLRNDNWVVGRRSDQVIPMRSLSLLMALSLPSRLVFIPCCCDPLCSSLSLLALFFLTCHSLGSENFSWFLQTSMRASSKSTVCHLLTTLLSFLLDCSISSQSPSRPALIPRGYQTTIGHSFRKHLLPGLDPPYFSRNLPLVLRRSPIHLPTSSPLHGGTCQGMRFNRLQSISHEWGSVPHIDNMKE
jgi:hypothetical protein